MRIIGMMEIKMINQKEKEYIIIIVAVDIKKILETIKKQEKEYIIIIMAIDTNEILQIINLKEKEILKIEIFKILRQKILF